MFRHWVSKAPGQAAGELPKGADSALLASFVHTVLQGLSIRARDGCSRDQAHAVVDVAMLAWDSAVGDSHTGAPHPSERYVQRSCRSMATVLQAVLPLLLLIWVGFFASASRRVADAEAGLNTFVLWFALPAFLFSAVAEAPIDQGVPIWFFVVSMAVPTVCFAVTWAGLALSNRSRGAARAAALAAGYGNVGYLGVPVVISVLGPEAGLAAGLGQLGPNLLFMVGYPVIAALSTNNPEQAAAGGDGEQESLARRLGAVVRRALLLNPVALAVLAGVLVGLAPWGLPPVLGSLVDLFSAAAVPAALFAIGLALRPALRGLRSGDVPVTAVAAATAVKMLLLPGLTIAALMLLGADLTSMWAAAAVLMATMPTSATAYLLAAEHDGRRGLGASTVFTSSTVSMVLLPLAVLLVL